MDTDVHFALVVHYGRMTSGMMLLNDPDRLVQKAATQMLYLVVVVCFEWKFWIQLAFVFVSDADRVQKILFPCDSHHPQTMNFPLVSQKMQYPLVAHRGKTIGVLLVSHRVQMIHFQFFLLVHRFLDASLCAQLDVCFDQKMRLHFHDCSDQKVAVQTLNHAVAACAARTISFHFVQSPVAH